MGSANETDKIRDVVEGIGDSCRRILGSFAPSPRMVPSHVSDFSRANDPETSHFRSCEGLACPGDACLSATPEEPHPQLRRWRRNKHRQLARTPRRRGNRWNRVSTRKDVGEGTGPRVGLQDGRPDDFLATMSDVTRPSRRDAPHSVTRSRFTAVPGPYSESLFSPRDHATAPVKCDTRPPCCHGDASATQRPDSAAPKRRQFQTDTTWIYLPGRLIDISVRRGHLLGLDTQDPDVVLKTRRQDFANGIDELKSVKRLGQTVQHALYCKELSKLRRILIASGA
ncbi:hypothetical protein G5I_05735 [Acromyrmex echinatior]|uniref:Uncharacterized protein n=1 Tax=Acromyrmex echinatior TaxID=103372 RepID=F4WJ58_ACREC|nr:hypothetical protein G5I_05735 [Acromyrmex echinatior]